MVINYRIKRYNEEGAYMKILVICGAGMGTSVIMKIKLTQFAQENELDATIESCGLDEGKGSIEGNDVVVCSTHIADEIGTIPQGTTLVAVENIMDINSYGAKILSISKQ